jgi:hypothetical protein
MCEINLNNIMIGIGIWINKNHLRENLFDLDLAYPNGRFINNAKINIKKIT